MIPAEVSASNSSLLCIRRGRAVSATVTIPGVRIVGTTITSEVGAAGNGGTPAAAAERIALNAFIKSSGLFDDVVDFYAVTTDPQTGALKPQFVPNTSIGGAGDHVHPNRAGYLTMGNSVNIGVLVH